MDENDNPNRRSPLGKRKAVRDHEVKDKRSRINGQNDAVVSNDDPRIAVEVAGRIAAIELENFMCHANLKVEFDVKKNNCFYIGGPNGSGKSALFAAMNIGLGGRGNHNDRGNSVKGYIKEGKNRAKISVTLTNCGEGRDPKYGDFILVERTINQTSSTYSLKSIKGSGAGRRQEQISTKKTDLDAVLARFGIELNNPIYWMSQDRSRHFLQKMEPSKLYEIFMKATELESTQESYHMCVQMHKEISHMLDNLRTELRNQKKEIDKWKEEKNHVRKEQDARAQYTYLHWLSFWAPVRDADEELEHWENKMKKIALEKKKNAQEQRNNTEERKHAAEQMDELNTKVEQCVSVVQQFRDELAKQDSEMRPYQTKEKQIEMKIQRLESEIRNNEVLIRDAEQMIKEAERRAANDASYRELEKYRQMVEDLTEKERQLSDERRTLEQNKENMDKNLRDAERENYQLRSQFSDISNKLREAVRIKTTMDATERDGLAKFGEDTARIKQLLERNAQYFERSPKGPIGMYVKVKDKRWLLAVEEALRNQLSGFIFHSRKDEVTFRKMLTQSGIRQVPNTNITRFGLAPHNVHKFQPDDNWLTVLRAVEIEDTDVRNALIDLAQIESHVLFESDTNARNVMNGRCPENCHRGQTMSGAMVYGSNDRGGQYRFYACKRNRALVLSADDMHDKAAIDREVDSLTRQKEHVNKKLSEAERDLRKAREGQTTRDRECHNVTNELSIIKKQIRRVKEKIEEAEDRDDDNTVIANQRSSITELEAVIGELEQKKVSLEEELDEIRNDLSEMQEKRQGTESEMNDYIEESAPHEDALQGLKMKIDAYDATDERFVDILKRLDAQAKKSEEERVNLLRKRDGAKDAAEKFEGPFPQGYSKENKPNFADIPSTEAVIEQCKRKTLEIETLAAQLKNLPSNEEIAEKKADFIKAKQLFVQLSQLFNQMKECYDIRRRRYPVIRHAITMRLKHIFCKLIKVRFSGGLEVDDERKEIRITVHPHAKVQNGEGLKDLKGLSGGERSYTTACFVMSLWDIMEAPFRCMDEFDVFMDMVNRKIVMDLLVKLATEQYSHHQFLFFTPQGINELEDRGRVQIFEMPKVRP